MSCHITSYCLVPDCSSYFFSALWSTFTLVSAQLTECQSKALGLRKLVMQVALGHEEAEICLDSDEGSLGLKDGEVSVHRGYGRPELHSNLRGCQSSTVRKPAHALILPDVKVGAIRISATGWEGWIIRGLEVDSRPSSS